MKRGDAHVHKRGELLDVDALIVVRAQPRHRFRDALHARIGLPDRRDAAAHRTAQQADQELVDHERREELRIGLPRHELEQARRGVEQLDIGLPM